jgi:23S rRNA pseudouridine1911/1915/1917 synthase
MNSQGKIEQTAPGVDFVAGTGHPRLDEFLARALRDVSLTRIRRLISDGEVTVNAEHLPQGYRLRSGDRVRIRTLPDDPSAATPEPIPLEIIHEDRDLIVVNKPVGMLSHPSHREKSGTLTNALAHHLLRAPGGGAKAGLVHRLDRDTSGVVLFAKTPRAHRILSNAFRERKVKKSYLALVSGRVARDSGEISAPIGSDPNAWPHWRVMEDGRPAVTRYQVRRRFAAHTLLELEPLTGRTHQLRIHCALIGHPIVGDPVYAPSPDPIVARLGLRHQVLHAHRLAFPHPATGKEMAVQAPMSRTLLDLLVAL